MADEEPLPPLRNDPSEWHDPQGVIIQLCAIHELEPWRHARAQSVTVLGGFAVCREHLSDLSNYLETGSSVEEIVRVARTGRF